MPLDQRVVEIADAALARTAPVRADVEYLLGFDGYSAEASYVEARAREIAFEAAEGVATVHAQIGVDAHPCPANCAYCSFAEVNVGICDDVAELPISVVVEKAQFFDRHGVHLISLMSTAGLPFSRYLEMVAVVRAAIGDDMPILANTRDLSLAQACALKDAGANAAYHAVRLGEGEFTKISPDQRRATIANIKEAGLALMTGVEPVWEGADVALLAERILELSTFEPYCIGACGLTATPGSALAQAGLRSPRTGFVRYVGAITRLACGYDARFGGVGGSVWVDAGTDPRNRNYGDAPEVLGRDIRRAKRTLARDGWIVPDRPDLSWLG